MAGRQIHCQWSIPFTLTLNSECKGVSLRQFCFRGGQSQNGQFVIYDMDFTRYGLVSVSFNGNRYNRVNIQHFIVYRMDVESATGLPCRYSHRLRHIQTLRLIRTKTENLLIRPTATPIQFATNQRGIILFDSCRGKLHP